MSSFMLRETSRLSKDELDNYLRLAISEAMRKYRTDIELLGNMWAKTNLEDTLVSHEMWAKACRAVLENPEESVMGICQKLGTSC